LRTLREKKLKKTSSKAILEVLVKILSNVFECV